MPASVYFAPGLITVSLIGTLAYSSVTTAFPVPDPYINFAGAGGNFNSRQATYRVVAPSATTPIRNGLRRNEIDLAKMIAVTNWFCRYQKPDYIVYWNYEVSNGQIFMGKYTLSCQMARQIAQNIGLGRAERVTLYNRGRANQAMVSPLRLGSRNRVQFQTLVEQVKPECLDLTPPVCPGDPLSPPPTSQSLHL